MPSHLITSAHDPSPSASLANRWLHSATLLPLAFLAAGSIATTALAQGTAAPSKGGADAGAAPTKGNPNAPVPRAVRAAASGAEPATAGVPPNPGASAPGAGSVGPAPTPAPSSPGYNQPPSVSSGTTR